MSKVTNITAIKTETGRVVTAVLRITEDRSGRLDQLVAVVEVSITTEISHLYDYREEVVSTTYRMEGEAVTAADLVALTGGFNENGIEDLERIMLDAESTDAKKVLVSYLHGLGDSGVDIGHDRFEFSFLLRGAVVSLMAESALADDDAPAENNDPFERSGKWHRAANIAMSALDKESRKMTANYERPQGLRWGDRLHEALMSAMRAVR